MLPLMINHSFLRGHVSMLQATISRPPPRHLHMYWLTARSTATLNKPSPCTISVPLTHLCRLAARSYATLNQPLIRRQTARSYATLNLPCSLPYRLTACHHTATLNQSRRPTPRVFRLSHITKHYFPVTYDSQYSKFRTNFTDL